mmetsp:Transcript_9795/g.17257  ORF Transcript_9795/g.17257 Transcript_9795/m.17257 type:complete len:772 (+) Transcript_9795:81-2396(+)
MGLRWLCVATAAVVAARGENAVGRVLENACQTADPSDPPFPYCDMALSPQERAVDLVRRLSIEEKTKLLANGASPIASAHVGGYQWWNEALHGVADSPGVTFDGPLRNATSFPQVITTAASFNTTLFHAIGAATSTEGRAFYNAGQAGLTFWTPNINVFRDPRWGRGQETPGEDPKLNGDYAEAFVQGFQFSKEEPHRLKASACCKHFAAYSIEDWHGMDRMTFNAQVSKRDLKETYMPAFESCVVKGKVSSLMCSYNAINGVPACVDQSLLTATAREEWGFDGYITGDCGAVENVFTKYHFNKDPSEVVRQVLEAGVDIACDNWLEQNSPKAIKKGAVPEELVDGALVNLIKVQMRLGMFDPDASQSFSSIGSESVSSSEHLQLALEAAHQGIVLLKNANDLLPFPKPAPNDAIALVGPHGESTKALLGNYFGVPSKIVTLLDAIAMVHDTGSRHGCHLSDMNSPEAWITEAEEAAGANGITILAVGIDQSIEREGHDRESVLLPGRQHELIRRVAAAAVKANKPPVIVVVVGGGMIDLSAELNDENVGAILWTGYPGMFGGQAVADTIFGENNPSGRLTQTFYPQSFVEEVDMGDMNMHPNESTGFPGRTYRFYTGEPVLPFGHGLSYSKYEHRVVSGPRLHDDEDTVHWKVNITNTGERSGQHVMLAFARPPKEAKNALLHGDLNRKLVGYVRTGTLAPGETEMAAFSISRSKDLTVYPQSDSEVPRRFDALDWQIELVGDADVEPLLLTVRTNPNRTAQLDVVEALA